MPQCREDGREAGTARRALARAEIAAPHRQERPSMRLAMTDGGEILNDEYSPGTVHITVTLNARLPFQSNLRS